MRQRSLGARPGTVEAGAVALVVMVLTWAGVKLGLNWQRRRRMIAALMCGRVVPQGMGVTK